MATAVDFSQRPKLLADALLGAIEGEVRFDDGSRALYATDASNYRQIPIGVVVPKTVEDAMRAVNLCREHGAPIVARGGGTSVTGAACNVAVVFDFSKYMRRVLEIDPTDKWARAEPGVVCDVLRDAAEEHGLTFGPDPATHNHCVLGGMIGNNSCGMHAQMSGRTQDNIHELDIVTYDGLRMTVGPTSDARFAQIVSGGGRRAEIYLALKALADKYGDLIRTKFPKIPRRVSGYALDELLPENGFNVARALVGSEGTCVLVLGAKTRLVYSPPKRSIVVVGFDDIATAADHVPEVISFGPTALEALDDKLVKMVRDHGRDAEALHLLPEGNSFLMVEFGGQTKEESDGMGRRMMARMRELGVPDARLNLADDPDREEKLWKVRESALGVTAFVKGRPDTYEGWEDSAVPPERMGEYLRKFRKLLDEYDLDTTLYGHFGQGCLHCRINFDLKSAGGIAKYREFVTRAADLVVSLGGSLSGEHGDGQSRAELLPKQFGPEMMQAFREFKRIWDPLGKMNPGKKIDAYPLDSNLRLGTDYDPKKVETHFHYPEDGGFAHATVRCVGVGECRRLAGGTMCPSFRATKEEKHSTRGRAHLLFEMLRGGLKKGWRDEHVKEALDLCLACKGCKGDCPVSVDLATLKAEFLSHYYQGRMRPLAAYSMGGIYWWSRIASRMPRLVNWVTHSKMSGLVKRLGGISPHREMPEFAEQTFKEWWLARARANPDRNADRPPVILWADTFTNHLSPDVGKAAVEVLEDAGYQVVVPKASLCCGRPLYDYGFLKTARRLLERTLEELAVPIRNGVPIVGLEPSCLAVFRDELCNLMPTDESARRLKEQTFLLSEFLNKKATHYRVPQLAGKALVQVHCHQRALFGIEDEKAVLEKMGLETEVLDAGCCGLAGSFGFEKDHYDLSVAIAEGAVAPKIRAAEASTIVLANGFSCGTQIAQLTDRKTFHLAQVLRDAIERRSYG